MSQTSKSVSKKSASKVPAAVIKPRKGRSKKGSKEKVIEVKLKTAKASAKKSASDKDKGTQKASKSSKPDPRKKSSSIKAAATGKSAPKSKKAAASKKPTASSRVSKVETSAKKRVGNKTADNSKGAESKKTRPNSVRVPASAAALRAEIASRKSASKDDQALRNSKKEKLQQMMIEKGEAEEAQKLLAAPTDEMLKPFRDAAKRNSQVVISKRKAEKKAAFVAKPLKNAKKYSVDLRVHTPISEGYFSTGGVDPAAAMVRLAKSKGLDMIAVTDYHTADFVDVVKAKALETSITVLPGIDLRCTLGSCDEVSLIALFPEEYTSNDLDKILKLLGIPENAKGRKAFTLREELKQVIKVVEANGGVLIPSRLDKSPSRTYAIKPLIEDYGFHAFDLVHPENPEFFKQHWPSGEFTFLSFSNANALGQIGSRGMTVRLSSPGFNGVKTLCARRKSASL